jgi:hypothetical protein
MAEAELVAGLGVAPVDVAAARADLFECDDFVLEKGRVFYTRKGEEKMNKRFGVDKKTGAASAQAGRGEALSTKDGAAAGSGEKSAQAGARESEAGGMTCDLVVTRVCPNPIFVECVQKNRTGERCVCRVTFNRRLKPGMVLEGCRHEKGRYVYPRRMGV